MDSAVLEEIGLTSGEAKVYLALLELGPSKAGGILRKSGLQNSVVHLCLNKLIEKGMVLCRELLRNDVLRSLGLPEAKISAIVNEAEQLCKKKRTPTFI